MALNQDNLRTWRGRISHAQRLQAAQHRRWLEAQWFLEGIWFERQGIWDYDSTPVNYCTAYVRTMVAAIYARNPYLFVNSRHAKFQPFADTMETVLNYYWNELGLKQQIKYALVDSLLTGIGWLETGYTATFESLDIQKQGRNGFLKRLFQKDEKAPEEQGVLNEYIKEFSAYATRISPWQVLLAPGYHDIAQMPYLAVIEDLSPEDLKRNPMYAEALNLDTLKATRTIRTDSSMLETTTKPTPTITHGELTMHRLFHVWDRRGQQRFILFEGSDQSVGPFDWPYSFEGFPYIPLIFNGVPETKDNPNPYPMSDVTPMIPQLKELYWLRTAMVRHRKRSGTLITTRKGALTEDQKRNLETGDDVAIVEVDDPAGLVNHSPPDLPPILFQLNDRIMADLDMIGGLSQVLLAAAPQQGRTATEVNLQAQATGIRTSEKVDVIEVFSVDLARHLASILWEFYQGPLGRQQIAEIVGEPMLTPEMWPSLPDDKADRRKMIQQEIEFRIEAGSTTPPKDKAVERQQFLSAINVIGALAPERIKKDALVERLLKRFDEKDLEEVIISHDQEEQQVAQQENQLLLQGVPQLVGPNEAHDVHLQVHAQASTQGSTPALDQHLLAHHQALQAKQPARQPQSGDRTSPRTAAAPEQLRQGVPQPADMASMIGRVLTQPGGERGGMPNV